MLRKDPFITGEYYHLYNRGIDKRNIFKSKHDYERFMMLLYLGNNEEIFRLDNLITILHKGYEDIMAIKKDKPLVSVGGWCLMTNHFHILVRQEVDGGITKLMRKLGVGYSMYFNIKYKRQGALFGGLFKSKCIKADNNYMRQLFAYIHLNPLDINFYGWEKEIRKHPIGMKDFLDSYRYSSYQDHNGVDRIEKNILTKENFPDYFGGTSSFKDFVESYYIAENSEQH